MNRKLMVMLVLCLFVTRLLAQSNATAKKIPEGAKVSNYRTVTKTQTHIDKYGDKKVHSAILYIDDSEPTKSDTIRKKILDMPEWKKEQQAIIDELHNSDTWKKYQEDVNKAMAGHWHRLDLSGNEEWQIKLAKAQDDLEHSKALATEREKSRLFNIKLGREIRRQLARQPRNSPDHR